MEYDRNLVVNPREIIDKMKLHVKDVEEANKFI